MTLSHHDLHLRRRAWLAAIVLLHLALLWTWRAQPHRAPEAALQPASELILLRLPPARPAVVPAPVAPPRAAVTAPRPAPPPAAVVQPEAPAAASAPAPQSITLPAPASAPDDPFAKPAPAPETLREKTRHAAAGIDRQLRKESLNKFATIVENETRLGRAIGKAYVGDDWILEQTSTVGDGVIMKRFRRGGQQVCEYTNLVGAHGQDPFRDGNKTKVMTCP